ncbi:MAG TPA: alpha/beta hydrolase [Isosphaeraceae bacterium]|nr:alpha/beta hydrolase [Isosphaeraceae bacterium]
MNASAGVTLIAGWAQTEQALAPLLEKLFPARSTVAPDWGREAEGQGTGNASSVTMTSVCSLLKASTTNAGFGGGSVASAYAVTLATRLARQKHPGILVGWSMGGIVALETAIHFPELVRRLVLISSCALFCPPATDQHEVRSLPVRAMILGLHRDRDETLRRFFSLVHSESGSAAQMAEDLKQALRLDPDHLVHGLRYIQTADLRSRLSAVRVPTLIAHGRKDRVISWHASQLLQAGIGGSDLLLVDEGDHGLVATSPGMLTPAIVRFFNADPVPV